MVRLYVPLTRKMEDLDRSLSETVCEAAIHTTQTYVNNDQNRGKVLLKSDFKNAFNGIVF
jgi:hypothetical protein